MGWMTQLYKTYENLRTNTELLKTCRMPLAPVSHMVQTAHIEVVININGDFVQARTIPKDMGLTIIPCSERSIGRTSGIAPHILFDNLKYTAGDAASYSGQSKLNENYRTYCENLNEWCDDNDCPQAVRAVYKYVIKGRLISDLINEGILSYDDEKLKWIGESGSKPAGDILSAFVKFSIVDDNGEMVDYSEIGKAYEKYDRKLRTQTGCCFVTGKESKLTYKHPATIRYPGDGVKLISTNDSSGYTYRGRFHSEEDAVAVGYEVSHNAHSALRWLIAKQGYKAGDATVIVWSVNSEEIPQVADDTMSLYDEDDELYDKYTPLDTYAKEIEKALNGYSGRNDDGDVQKNNRIVIMILEAATPGRLSIVYYREFVDLDYIENIRRWHTTCVWNHDYKYEKEEFDQETGKKKSSKKHVKFTGAPSIIDMIFSIYGSNVDDKVKKHLFELFISCISDRKRIPYSIIMKGVNRISNPVSMEEWDVRKSTSIICALIRKYYYDKGEVFNMSVDYENKDRSYLFGRVLAYAERIEEYANYLGGDRRVPNARKLRNKFRLQPAKTLVSIDDKLEPYVERIYSKGGWLYRDMQNVISQINEMDFMDNKPLSPKYLLGYACQMGEFYNKKDDNEAIEEEI